MRWGTPHNEVRQIPLPHRARVRAATLPRTRTRVRRARGDASCVKGPPHDGPAVSGSDAFSARLRRHAPTAAIWISSTRQ